MNKSPLNPITDAHIRAYRDDGVVCLRQMFDIDWIERLHAAWVRVRQRLTEAGADVLMPRKFLDGDPLLQAEMEDSMNAATMARKYESGAPITGSKYMSMWDPDFRAYALESPAGEIVGRVMQAEQVRFFWDQIFEKRAGGNLDTYWHNDQGAWPTRGEHLPSFWLPLTPISEDQSLEYIAGSHHDRTRYWGKSWNARNAEKAGQRPADRPDFIDFEQKRGDPQTRFLKWAMEPGDVMMFHPRVYHGGGPNRNPNRARIALATRWFGDDIRWDPRIGDVNVPGIPLARMRIDQGPDDDELFPVVWRKHGSLSDGWSG